MFGPHKICIFKHVNVTLKPRHWTQDTAILLSGSIPNDQRHYLVRYSHDTGV